MPGYSENPFSRCLHHHITEKIIGAAYNVHNTPGPGFLEKDYQNSSAIELRSFGFIIGVGIFLHVPGRNINILIMSLQSDLCLFALPARPLV